MSTVDATLREIDRVLWVSGFHLPAHRGEKSIRDKGKKARARLRTAVLNYIAVANPQVTFPQPEQSDGTA